MALKTRMWTAGKVMLLVAALGLTYVIFAAGAMRIAIRTRDVQVPDFRGRTTNEATAMANSVELAIRIDEARRPDPKVPAGRVGLVAQQPLPLG